MTEGSSENHIGLRILLIGLRKFIILGVITIIFAILFLKLDELSVTEPTKWSVRDCGDIDLQATYQIKPSDQIKPLDKMKSSEPEAFTKAFHAKSYWNPTGIIFEKGITYNIKVLNPYAKWADATHNPNPNEGWWPNQKAPLLSWDGFTYLLSKLGQFAGILRAPKEYLFVLMGAIYGKCEDGRMCAKHFLIGNGVDFTAPADGEFCAYANDLSFTYGNNSGALTLQITREK